MPLGLLGKKIGMTRIYTEAGDAIPVTVVEVRGNTVVQVKTADKDGYDAAQVGFVPLARICGISTNPPSSRRRDAISSTTGSTGPGSPPSICRHSTARNVW